MASLPLHFRILFKKINPPEDRRELARDLVGAVRTWLEDHDFETVDPHTLLIGSYARSTAVLWIKDVDVLVILPDEALDRTPHAVLLELREVLEGYPNAVVNASGQRRSIRLELEEHDFFLDLVPAVAADGLEKPLEVPDRPRKLWIDSDPLGYMRKLTDLNQEHARRLVRLIKLIKAWRDANMKTRRPKSYMLEVMVVQAVEAGKVVFENESWPSVLAQLFGHWADKYDDLMEKGDGVPRIYDPQLGHLISSWERPEFETFMRRVREANRAIQRVLAADEDQVASEDCARIFGDCWPTQAEVDEAAENEADNVAPSRSRIASTGLVVGPTAIRTIPSLPTRFHGGRERRPSDWPRPTDRPIAQVVPISGTFPQFGYRMNRHGGFVWRGTLQPTPDSPAYPLRIVHNPTDPPKVWVPGYHFDPACRHLYRDKSLCLYWPKQWWWTVGASMVNTIVPWSAFWLYYYELWEATGRWWGPSSPHGLRPEERN